MILCSVWFIVCFLVNTFQCTPVEAAWNVVLVVQGQARCIRYGKFILGYEVTNMLLDIGILSLPIYGIRRLQLPTQQKLALGAVFVLGGL